MRAVRDVGGERSVTWNIKNSAKSFHGFFYCQAGGSCSLKSFEALTLKNPKTSLRMIELADVIFSISRRWDWMRHLGTHSFCRISVLEACEDSQLKSASFEERISTRRIVCRNEKSRLACWLLVAIYKGR